MMNTLNGFISKLGIELFISFTSYHPCQNEWNITVYMVVKLLNVTYKTDT